MKIAMFTDVFLEVPGGIPSSIRAQKVELEKAGHEVVVFCPGWRKTDDETIIITPTCKYLKPGGAPFSRNPNVVERWIEVNYPSLRDFDIIHSHYEAGCSIAGMRLAKKYHIPLVQTMHGREDMALIYNIPHPFKNLAGCLINWMHARYLPHKISVKKGLYFARNGRQIAPTVGRAKMWTMMVNHANFADVVVTPSHHFADKLKRCGVEREIKIVSNGIKDEAVTEFEALTGGNLVRERKANEPLKLFWGSRVSNEKRMMPLLKAISLANEAIRMDVYGDGNALGKAKRFVKRHHLEQSVKFHGRVAHEKMLKKMAAAHISAVVSYDFDNQSMTMLEAKSVGMPIFYVDDDMNEIVPEGAGVLTTDPSPEAMAKSLDELARQPEKIRSMSEIMVKHRNSVLQSEIVADLLEAYKSAM